MIQVSPTWPSAGVVVFYNVHLCYRQGLPNALDGVTFCTNAAEKIGIVGRTGSGKSSLFLALFRMVEIHKGEILVDGTNLQHIDLKDIRFVDIIWDQHTNGIRSSGENRRKAAI